MAQNVILKTGVKKREVIAWAFYDFANSGYTTVVLTSVFSAYFVGVLALDAGLGTLWWTLTLSASYLLLMVTLPRLGYWADKKAKKKRLLLISTVACVFLHCCCFLLVLDGYGGLFLLCFFPIMLTGLEKR